MAYRILVVEDEPDIRDLLDFTLRWNGHDVDLAEGGREALERLADRSYDVILTNLHMPGCLAKTSTAGLNTGGRTSHLVSSS
jgi:CheY-like chemotaxis protein